MSPKTSKSEADSTAVIDTVLPPDEWKRQAEDHAARAHAYTDAHLERRSRGVAHPVFDFLFDYYPIRPAQLSRWHPGIGVALAGECPHREWKGYTTLIHEGQQVTVFDAGAAYAAAPNRFDSIRKLLAQTLTRPGRFDCFGLHEWAMVYRARPRHNLPLRLGASGTDDVVESHHLRCTHVDAYRFFTPAAKPLNITPITREDQPALEQCGCLHATMDLYKWAAKLGGCVPGSLWMDCFDLAWQCRILDMEASPYDCTSLGFGVVAIETARGKATYVARQRELAEKAAPLRQALIDVIDRARELAEPSR